MLNPQDTYALVVGIEKYNPGSYCDNLDGPASNALEFAEWLLLKGVPKENICLFISERDVNQAKVDALNIPKQKATRENIYQAITKTIPSYGNNGELLYIYWSGHGASNGVGDRRFFYDNGTENLNLNNLLKALKTDVYDLFEQQVLIFDACATYYSKKSSKSLSNEEYPDGEPNKDCQQVILLATKEGKVAKNIEAEQTGLFSQVLLEELNKENKLVIPSGVQAVMDRVKREFGDKYADEPSPITLSYTNNPEGYFNRDEFPKVYSNQAARNYNFLEQEWNSLTKILSLVNWQTICSCCIKVLSQYSNDPYSISSQLLLEKDYAVLKEILLEKKYQENNEFKIPLVLVFVQNLLQEEISEEAEKKLIEWRDKIAQELNIDINKIPQQARVTSKNKDKDSYAKLNPFLLILFEPISSSGFNIEAELVFQQNDFAENKSKPLDISQGQYNNISSEKICEKCCQLIAESNRYLLKNSNELTIEFFFPRKYLLELYFDNQSIEAEDSEWFGSKYKTTTRYYERCKDYTHRKDLIKNWELFEKLVRQLAENPDVSIQDQGIADQMYCLNFEEETIRWKKLRRNLSNEKKIGLNIDLPLLSPDYKGYIDEFLNTILRCGLPFSFWLRDKRLEELKLNESQEAIDIEFKDFLKFEHFKQPEILLEYIRKVRDDSYVEDDDMQDKYLGYHLGFLCDNPHRLPSWFDEEKGEDVYTFVNR